MPSAERLNEFVAWCRQHLSGDEKGDCMVSLVEQMLALHRQAGIVRTPREQTALTRQIGATDTQIDRLVYDLYGLTDNEIKIVEGAGAEPPAPSAGKD